MGCRFSHVKSLREPRATSQSFRTRDADFVAAGFTSASPRRFFPVLVAEQLFADQTPAPQASLAFRHRPILAGRGFSHDTPNRRGATSFRPPSGRAFAFARAALFVPRRAYSSLHTCTILLSSVVRQNDADGSRRMRIARQPGRNSIPKTGFAPSRPLSPISNRHTVQPHPSVSVNSVRLPSAPSVFQSFDSRLEPTPQNYVRTPRTPASVLPAEIPTPILEFNVNHSKQTPIPFLIATLFCD